MSDKIKYVQFEISADEHRKLKLLCIENDCTLKSLLQEAVSSYVSTTEQNKEIQQNISEGEGEGEGEGESPAENESLAMKMCY